MSREEEDMEFHAPPALHMEEGIVIVQQGLIEQIIIIIMKMYTGEVIPILEEGEEVLEVIGQDIKTTMR